MSYTVVCSQPNVFPEQVTLSLHDPKLGFRLVLLKDAASAGLLGVVPRLGLSAAPENEALERLLIAFTIDESDNQIHLTPAVGGAGLDVIGTDGTRRKVETFRQGLPCFTAITLAWGEHTTLTLQVVRDAVQGALPGAGGLEFGADAALIDLGTALWALPTASNVLAAPGARVLSAVKASAQKLRLPPTLITPLIFGITLLLTMGYSAWTNHQRAEGAAAEAEAQAQAQAAAQAQATLAQAGEATCMEERNELAAELQDATTLRRTALEGVLQRTQAQATAMVYAGQQILSSETVPYDQQAWERLLAQLVPMVGSVSVAASQVKDCQDQVESLGRELPALVLLWHPQEDQSCRDPYRRVEGQVDLAGPWGLSVRAARLYGEGFSPTPAELGREADPRLRVPWSARTYANGLNAALRGLLTAQRGGRPPLAPSTAPLWAVAVWDAYNRLPEPVQGGESTPVEVCAADLVAQVAASPRTLTPGEPVLPDITLIAGGAHPELFQATTACPWPRGSLHEGAARALLAAARAAQLALPTPNDDT